MLRTLLLTFILSVSYFFGFSQDCLPNGVVLTSQADVDLFPATYPGCSVVGGTLSIQGSGVMNLDSLYTIQKVEGDFRISNTSLIDFGGMESLDTIIDDIYIGSNSILEDFTGLDNLLYIGGNYSSIVGNTLLLDFNGLGSLIKFSGELSIWSNSSLESFEGLSSLTSIGTLMIDNNSSLEDLDGLVSLDTIENWLNINDSPGLTSLTGLENLAYVLELELRNNTLLSDISSLSNLTSVDYVTIEENPELLTLAGLESIVLETTMRIRDNNKLVDITALELADLTEANHIYITGNDQLNSCAVTSICDHIDVGGNITIGNNAPGCNSVVEVTAECCVLDMIYCPEPSDDCLPNGIVLTSQSDVDLFPSTYPGCSVVGGTLSIQGSGVTNLDSLYNIEKIEGDFRVSNTSLIDFGGMESLDTIIDDIYIGSNSILEGFTGLDNLLYIGGNYSSIVGNTLLLDFSGLGSLIKFAGELSIWSNSSLESFEGLSSLTSIGTLMIDNNSSLEDLDGLVSLDTIENWLNINDSPGLTSLTGLENLTYVQELELRNNTLLSDISSLSNLTSVDYVTIEENPELLTLAGLESIVLETTMRIRDNNKLVDITALELADLTEANHIYITGNDQLNSCAVTSICDHIDVGGNITIGNNAPGCNSVVEVTAECCVLDMIYCPEPSDDCLPNGIVLTSQSDVDLFPSTYPGCSVVGGTLSIQGSGVTNLDSLYNIEKIEGDFRVSNTSLIDFGGMESLDTIIDDIYIGSNSILEGFTGLDNLLYIGGNYSSIVGNTLLLDFSGLGSLIKFAGELSIWSNSSLESFEGLSSLTSIGTLMIDNNSSLEDLDGLVSLDTIENWLNINDSPGLTSLTGLENLTYVQELELRNNTLLSDISSLSNLTSVDYVTIEENPELLTLAGLESIVLETTLRIRDNDKLTDITAIELADLTGANSIYITGNDQLNSCAVTAICDYIDLGGNTTIANNAPGCNSVVEVEADCDGYLYVFDSSNGVWHEDTNWVQQSIPSGTSYVLIPDGTDCTVESDSTATCNYIYIHQNANFTVSPGAEFFVLGN